MQLLKQYRGFGSLQNRVKLAVNLYGFTETDDAQVLQENEKNEIQNDLTQLKQQAVILSCYRILFLVSE